MGRRLDEAVKADVKLRLCGVATDSTRVVRACDPAFNAVALLALPREVVALRDDPAAPRFAVEGLAAACPFLEGAAAACALVFFCGDACFAGAANATIATEATNADTDKKKCLTSPL
jgi:hypothetical protein